MMMMNMLRHCEIIGERRKSLVSSRFTNDFEQSLNAFLGKKSEHYQFPISSLEKRTEQTFETYQS